MRIRKKKMVKPLVLALAASQCMTSFAGTWVSTPQNQWSYVRDDGTKQPGGWFTDPADKKKYYINDDGMIFSGWKQIDGIWYFFNTVHDGTFGGALVSKWQWIDGYCYLFDAEGKMYANTTTPDGFVVNADGQWMENGKAVYVSGKGIITKSPGGSATGQTATVKRSSGGGGGGGGGSSSGSGSSSKTVYYSYVVRYLDTEGNLLATTEGETVRNSFITIATRQFDGYEFIEGQPGSQKVTQDGATFLMTYKKSAGQPDHGDKDNGNTDESSECAYTVLYIDSEDGHTLNAVTGREKKGKTVSVGNSVEGYTAAAGNTPTFTVTGDGMVIRLYFNRKEESCSYTIRYEDEAGNILELVSGNAVKGSSVTIPKKTFDGYTCITDRSALKVDKNGAEAVIRFRKNKVDDDHKATDSNADKEEYSYVVSYIDRDTGEILMKETGAAKEDEEIIPSVDFDGYRYADSYHFTVGIGKNMFKVYLIRTGEDEDFEDVKYTVTCVDENGTELKVFHGTVTVGDEPVTVKTSYDVEGYELDDDAKITVTRDGANNFTLRYKKTANSSLTVVCRDIDTMADIETKTIPGNTGESVSLAGICPDGYEAAGELPESATISSNESNNTIYLYYKKIVEKPDVKKEVPYTIRFRAYGDNDAMVMNDVTGTWTLGEKLPYYFAKVYNDAQGRTWTAIGDSPQIFTVSDRAANIFTIEFKLTGQQEEINTERKYTIKYVAEDTGSVLGITTGIGHVGDQIPYMNTSDSYGFAQTSGNYHVISDDGNTVEVILKRNKFPGPEKNPSTGKYDGYEWLALFVDDNGNQLLPNVSGFTVKGDRLRFDYPDTIEKDGVTYRAVTQSPYIEYTDQTTYQQYVIRYVAGETSETKLDEWTTKAQEKKDAFYGTTPYHFFVAYREKNSWNDIGLQFGMGAKDSTVEIGALDIPGWNIPSENLGSFTLDADGKTQTAQYEKPNDGTSSDYNKRGYTVRIVDEDDNDLFDPYSGYAAFVKGNSSIDFPVYFPSSFQDSDGNRWEADETSPKNFVLSAMDANELTVRYHKTYVNKKEEFIVEDNTGFNRILNDFASHTNDSSQHEYYVIGRGYDTSTAEVSATMSAYRLAGYSNEVVDTFTLDGVTYTVSRVRYYRKWEQNACTHDWEAVEDLSGNCLTTASHTVRCTKCGEEVTVLVPATGHKDKDHDGRCDVCSVQLSQNLGDAIAVTWDSGSLGFGTKKYTFTCIDTDYNGTGKMLFIASEGVGSDLYGTYTTADSAAYTSSMLQQFLDDAFADGLSNRLNLNSIDGNAVSILTKEEYDHYREEAENKFDFPEGIYLTKGDSDTEVILTNGTTVSKEEASAYEAHPVILLDRSGENQKAEEEHWNVGDLQAREINGKLYLFRCVDENYMDKSSTDKSMALFLCDTVIPSNEGLGFDEADGTQSTRFFGSTNNYKYSAIHEWLTANNPDTDNLIRMNIGIKNEYTGSSATGLFGSVTAKSFSRYTRSTPQVLYSGFFIPSLEEALSMKDYLWKVDHSDENNAESIITKYCGSYWLRTPEYGTDDMVYTVNLKTGAIEPRSVKATENNDLCDIGIRPMYAMYQGS